MAQPSNRDQLLRGAMKCLRTKGYARTTARDIAAASGANLASIGYHFGSKEALLNEAMIRLFKRRDWKVGGDARSASDATPLVRLRAFFNAADAVFEAPRPLFVAFVEAIAQAGHSPELREQLAAYYRDVRRALGETVLAILGNDDLESHPETIASVVLAMLDGTVLQWLLDPDSTPSASEMLEALIETIAAVRDNRPPPVSGPTPRRGRPAKKTARHRGGVHA